MANLRSMKKIIVIEGIILFLLVMVILTHLLGIVWSSRAVVSSCQPHEVQYKSYDPYCVSIIKMQQTLGSRYFILVAKTIEPSYGHVLNYPSPEVVSDRDIVEDTKINWVAE